MRLKILPAACHRPRPVNEIVTATGSTQANVSKPLARLAAGIRTRRKAGQCVACGVKDRLVVKSCELVRAQVVVGMAA
jgi:DNA-binding transcriptional ArsR family regulator